MPTLFLVRHAEPALMGVLLGGADPALSADGMRAAAQIWHGRVPPAVVYTSPMQRAKQTALLMTDRVPVVLDDLREIGYGEWDGRTWAEIEAADPKRARQKLDDWFSVTPPGGEPWSEFRARVRVAAERVVCGAGTVAIVAHAAVNAVIAERFAGSDPLRFRQEYGEVVAIEV